VSPPSVAAQRPGSAPLQHEGDAGQPGGPHPPFHGAPGHPVALPAPLGVDVAGAVDAAVGGVDGRDPLRDHHVGHRPGRGRPRPVGVVGARATCSTLQIGSTPNSSLFASMESTISAVGGRAPPRRRPRRTSRSRPPGAAHGSPAPAPRAGPRPRCSPSDGDPHRPPPARPSPQRVRVRVQLLTDPSASVGPRRRIPASLHRQPDRSLPMLLRVLPRCCHGSHPLGECEPPSKPGREKFRDLTLAVRPGR